MNPENINKMETNATRDLILTLTDSCQSAGDKSGLGKFLSAHVSNNQIMAVFVHGCIQFNADGAAIDLKKFN